MKFLFMEIGGKDLIFLKNGLKEWGKAVTRKFLKPITKGRNPTSVYSSEIILKKVRQMYIEETGIKVLGSSDLTFRVSLLTLNATIPV